MSLTNQELLNYLEEASRQSTEQFQYYTVKGHFTMIAAPMMEGIFLKSRPFECVILAVYRYMKDNKIPIFSGSKKGLLIENITDLIYGDHPKSLHHFGLTCECWISDHTINFDRLKIIE